MERSGGCTRSWMLAIGLIALLSACGGAEESSLEDTGPTDTEPVVTTAPPIAPEEAVAVLFVGHGEPSSYADGDVEISFADGSSFGPFAVDLDVPSGSQSTEWAAAYEEIATAMTYIFPDLNENEVPHELMLSPKGDVPPFFTWEAFRAELVGIYSSFDDHSPHNELLAEHVANLDLDVDGAQVDSHLAYLDAVPRIADVMFDIGDDYHRFVVVPMLLASSTHTQELIDQITDAAPPGADVVVADPFYEVPFMRDRISVAVTATADRLREAVPADAAEDEIGVLLVAHGTPFSPPDPALGWRDGEIYSHLSIVEDEFHAELAEALPWAVRTGRMNYAEPSIAESLAAFEADGIKHVLVVPSAFPTAAMHTMWDVADPAVGRALTPDEGMVAVTRDSGMTVYYSAEGYADVEPGREHFRSGLEFIATSGVSEILGHSDDASP